MGESEVTLNGINDPGGGAFHDSRVLLHPLLTHTILAFLLFCPSGSHSTSAQDTTPRSEILRREVQQIAAAADRFRLQATANTQDAVSNYGIDGFPERWGKDIEPYFRGEEWQLAEFFAYSLVMVGRVESPKCVVGFYNPWIDVILLAAWKERGADGWKVTDFALCAGERLREEKPGDDFACPAWMKPKKPIAESILDVCARTIAHFQRHFPIARAFQFPVLKLPASPETESAILKARMSFRLTYFNEKLGTSVRRKALDDVLQKTVDTLARGDKEAIQALTPPEAAPYVAETICLFPQEVRTCFLPHWFVPQDDKAVVVISSPRAPRWFVLLFLDFTQRSPALALGLYDFEVTRRADPAMSNGGERP